MLNHDVINYEDLDKICEIYEKEIRDQKLCKDWPSSVYAISKLLLSVYTKVLSRQNVIVEKDIQVYAACPGWCQTDLTKGSGAKKTAEEGAGHICELVRFKDGIDPEHQGGFY